MPGRGPTRANYCASTTATACVDSNTLDCHHGAGPPLPGFLANRPSMFGHLRTALQHRMASIPQIHACHGVESCRNLDCSAERAIRGHAPQDPPRPRRAWPSTPDQVEQAPTLFILAAMRWTGSSNIRAKSHWPLPPRGRFIRCPLYPPRRQSFLGMTIRRRPPRDRFEIASGRMPRIGPKDVYKRLSAVAGRTVGRLLVSQALTSCASHFVILLRTADIVFP